MKMIYDNDKLSMNDLAEALDLTNGAITMNVAKLEEAGLVSIKSAAAKRGAEGYTQLRRSDPVK